jgi:hypothetical protein
MSEKKPLLHRMLGDKLNGPPEWENAAEKVKFVTLRVGVADGTVWAVNILGKPLHALGPVAGARAAITDPVTKRSKVGIAGLAAGLVADNSALIFGSKTKVTKWETAVAISGQVVATNTIESLSLAKDALQQVIAFNKLAGTDDGPRADGKPVEDRAPRFMLGLCEFGAGTSDPDTVPAFDAEGQLVMAAGEAVLWTGSATPAAEAAQAAGGREQFTTLWKSSAKAAVTLTTQRLVYDIRDFTAGDMSWLTIGAAAGPASAALSAVRAGSHHSGQTAAGQIRHENLANLITGANARTTFAGPATVTATVLEPPKWGIRLHLIADDQVEDLAQRWVRAAATERLHRLASQLAEQPDKRDQLLAQQNDPKPHDGYWGPFWGLPLARPLGQGRPRVGP